MKRLVSQKRPCTGALVRLLRDARRVYARYRRSDSVVTRETLLTTVTAWLIRSLDVWIVP